MLNVVEDFDIFLVINMSIYWFGIRSFIGGNIAGDFIFLFFLVIRFYGVTPAPVNTDKREAPVRIFSSTIITFGAGGYYWLIKFGALVIFWVLIDSLGIMSFPEIGSNNFSFDFFLITWWFWILICFFNIKTTPRYFPPLIWCYRIITHWKV